MFYYSRQYVIIESCQKVFGASSLQGDFGICLEQQQEKSPKESTHWWWLMTLLRPD